MAQDHITHLIFNSDKEIRCAHYAIIARVAALKKKYKGGVKAFVEKHDPQLNRDIAVLHFMGGNGMEELVTDFENNDLVDPVDYAFYSAFHDALEYELRMQMKKNNKELPDFKIEPPAPWLKVYYHNGGVMVSYVDQKKEYFETTKGSAFINHVEKLSGPEKNGKYKIIFQDGTYAIVGEREYMERLARLFSSSLEDDDLQAKLAGHKIIYYLDVNRELLRFKVADEFI